MPLNRWSTDTVGTHERSAYWREAVCQTVLNVSIGTLPDHFAAEIRGRQFGALRFASFHATGHDIVRERGDIARSSDDHFLVSLQRAGHSHIAQGDTAFALTPGEIAILDGERPFRVGFSDGVSRILALIPRATLESRAPWLKRNPAHRLALAEPFTRLAGAHLRQLMGAEALANAEAALLTDNLCNLLALGTAPQAGTSRAGGVPLDVILAWCRQNLAEPGLTPSAAAAALGLSVRTLHLRFAESGQSFGAWLLANRLDLARRVLANPRRVGTIAEVAFGCGFRDLSHFNRTFRARFGLTPGECRAAGGQTGAI